jgi:phosphoenolpyruvate---glycerone phosphotransferase subunit DhaL
MKTITREQVLDWLRLTGKVLEENREYLTQLDAAIGDADHGINMDRGFKKVVSQLPSLAQKDIGEIFKGAGMALISSVGGASGPLYGTFFLRAGGVINGKEELGLADLAAVWKAGLSGVVERGRAQPGDKTMVDALTPGVEALGKSAQNNGDLSGALKLALEAVEQGMKNTIPLLAKKGRASYLGERSIGHQDPGATSSFLMLKALSDTVSGKV